jgi:hypothetical protein
LEAFLGEKSTGECSGFFQRKAMFFIVKSADKIQMLTYFSRKGLNLKKLEK